MKKHNQSESLKPMLEALRDLDCDNRLKSQAVQFMQTDFSRLVTEQAFMEAYNGLAACQRLLGPISESYRKTLLDMLRMLESSVKARNQMTPDEWLNISREHLEKLLSLLQKHLPHEVWEKVGATIEHMFNTIINQG